MTGPRLLFTLALLWTEPLLAQGPLFQFTWHGESNLFQAAFVVHDYELSPGTNFSSDLFLNSISVTNPLGEFYHGGDSSSSGSGTYVPWNLNLQLNDFQRNTEALVFSAIYSGATQRTSGIVEEKPFSSPNFLWTERGFWSVAQIPEPSVVTLLALSMLAFLVHPGRNKRRC
ncbi:MAG TPA: hypothetical protein VLT36_10370 [Candidatus Dormibacteraeota bacterium]|nr:hypothetical protein [Candidatus Dormibacteraeota bacterium]